MTKDRFSLPKASLLTLLMTGVSATSLGISIATAQEADTVSRQKTITVTATRRDESLVDVPYNISAVTGADIEAASILDDAELLRSIPGVAVVDRGARNSGTMNSARIRGLAVDSNGLGDYAVSAVASVSTYVNDTPIFANFLLRDLERVEVLRGPQGTLYGSGSLGGTIRYITRDPDLGEYNGYVSASGSSVEGSESLGFGVDGAFNMPLGDKAALRIVGSAGDYPGITDYVNVYELDSSGIPVAPNGHQCNIAGS